MENQVTMSLSEYTKLILENQELHLKLQSLKKKAETLLQEDIRDGLINSLKKEEIIDWLKADTNEILKKFGPYSWTYDIIANEVLVVDKCELIQIAVRLICNMLNARLNWLLEKENE